MARNDAVVLLRGLISVTVGFYPMSIARCRSLLTGDLVVESPVIPLFASGINRLLRKDISSGSSIDASGGLIPAFADSFAKDPTRW